MKYSVPSPSVAMIGLAAGSLLCVFTGVSVGKALAAPPPPAIKPAATQPVFGSDKAIGNSSTSPEENEATKSSAPSSLAVQPFAKALTKPAAEAAAGKPADAALARTQKLVRMLDGFYKNAIVLVTTHYVTEDSDLPAGTAFKALFDYARKEGWHDVRLIDATGEPYSAENVAKSDFEKRAIPQLVAGKSYVEEVVEKDGKRYLHAATAIPVVMQKCVLCHDNYADVPAGKAIGALGYVVPIE